MHLLRKRIEMKKDRALVVYVIDASGSMGCRRDAVVSAVNESLDEHMKSEIETLISIYTFSGTSTKVVDFANAKISPKFKYSTGGSTALFDAIGHAINDVGSKLSGMLEEDRPSSVQIMIITDGEENSSIEFNSRHISDMVKHQTEKYSWLFTYLGSNQDAILAGKSLGIGANLCATYTDNNFGTTMRTVTNKMCLSKGMDYSSTVNLMSYSDQERENLVSDDNR